RQFENNGAESNHAAWILGYPIDDDGYNLEVSIDYFDQSTERIHLEYYDGKQYKRLGTLQASQEQLWKSEKYKLPKHILLGEEEIEEESKEEGEKFKATPVPKDHD